MNRKIALFACLALAAAASCLAIIRSYAAQSNTPSSYLFVWAGETNVAAYMSAITGQSEADARHGSDFLAVFDVLPRSGRYGRLVATLPVGNAAETPHHTNYSMPADDVLFANDFDAAQTFIFDLHDPLHPKLKGSFGAAGAYTHPHSFVLLPNGDTLSTFQQKGGDDTAAGALVELDPQGRMVRSSLAADPTADPFIRPYSLEVIPSLDRVVSTSADMYMKGESHVIQVWRLSDLKLLKTVVLPHVGAPAVVAVNSSEPRLLADGHTVLVGTFNCGLYRLDGLEGTNPSATLVYDFGDRVCSVPVVTGHFWIEALTTAHCVVSLDVSDPSHPVEVGRIVLGPQDQPHWLAAEPNGNRIVITGYKSLFYRLLIANVDLTTGKLSLDDRFREEGSDKPGFSFDRHWPDGWNGPAIPHGAVFSLPAAN
jgi:hypothetical protein